jgi:hypothetical protein
MSSNLEIPPNQNKDLNIEKDFIAPVTSEVSMPEKKFTIIELSKWLEAYGFERNKYNFDTCSREDTINNILSPWQNLLKLETEEPDNQILETRKKLLLLDLVTKRNNLFGYFIRTMQKAKDPYFSIDEAVAKIMQMVHKNAEVKMYRTSNDVNPDQMISKDNPLYDFFKSMGDPSKHFDMERAQKIVGEILGYELVAKNLAGIDIGSQRDLETVNLLFSSQVEKEKTHEEFLQKFGLADDKVSLAIGHKYIQQDYKKDTEVNYHELPSQNYEDPVIKILQEAKPTNRRNIQGNDYQINSKDIFTFDNGECGIFKYKNGERKSKFDETYYTREGSYWRSEYAAYLVSKIFDLGVPQTVLRVDSKKGIGSLQHFLSQVEVGYHSDKQSDPQGFAKMMLLDEISDNCDRRSEEYCSFTNWITQNGKIIPIDNGISFNPRKRSARLPKDLPRETLQRLANFASIEKPIENLYILLSNILYHDQALPAIDRIMQLSNQARQIINKMENVK